MVIRRRLLGLILAATTSAGVLAVLPAAPALADTHHVCAANSADVYPCMGVTTITQGGRIVQKRLGDERQLTFTEIDFNCPVIGSNSVACIRYYISLYNGDRLRTYANPAYDGYIHIGDTNDTTGVVWWWEQQTDGNYQLFNQLHNGVNYDRQVVGDGVGDNPWTIGLASGDYWNFCQC